MINLERLPSVRTNIFGQMVFYNKYNFKPILVNQSWKGSDAAGSKCQIKKPFDKVSKLFNILTKKSGRMLKFKFFHIGMVRIYSEI